MGRLGGESCGDGSCGDESCGMSHVGMSHDAQPTRGNFFWRFFLDEIIAHSEVVFAVVMGFSRTG